MQAADSTGSNSKEAIGRWRAELTRRIVWFLCIVYAPHLVYLMFNTSNTFWIPVLAIYSCLVVMGTLLPKGSKWQIIGLVALPFLFSINIALNHGMEHGARLYAILAVVLAALLLGTRAGIMVMVAGPLMILALYFGGAEAQLTSNGQLSVGYDWPFIFVLEYFITAGLILYSLRFIVERLEKSVTEAVASSAEKEQVLSAERQKGELYQLLADNIQDMVWVIDLNLKVTYVSPSVKNFNGYEAEEVMAMEIADLITEASLKDWQAILEAQLENTRNPGYEISPKRMEGQYIHQNGRLIDAEINVVFLLDDNGTPNGVLGVTRDITERRKLEKAMDTVLLGIEHLAGADFFTSLANNLRVALDEDAVVISELVDTDRTKPLAVCNENGDLALNESPVYERPCEEIVTKGESVAYDDALIRFPKGAFLQKHQYNSYFGVPIKNEEGQVVGHIAALSKVAHYDQGLSQKLLTIFAAHAAAEIERRHESLEKELIRQQLLQSQKIESVGQLAGGIAHDFNNLLVVINGYLEIAGTHAKDNPELDNSLGQIHKAADRAAGLTRQLLSFSRRQIMEKKPLQLNELIEGLHGLLTRLLPENIEYQTILGVGVGGIEGDKGQIEQAIVNMAVNGRDAMPGGGKLTIETENILIDQNYVDTHPGTRIGRYVLVRVSDTGEGVPPEIQERIFEPFFTTKPEGQGTGLGLSVLLGIVKQHDGFTHLYSEMGKGTELRLYFPIVERSVQSLERKLEAKLERGGETLLLVEDDEQVRELAERLLSRAGYTVVSAEDGEIAVEKFKEYRNSVSLVVLDVVLPKLGGNEVRKEIIKLEPDVPILFTSGYSANGIHTNFILQDGLILLQKPYNSESLLRKVRELIDEAKD